MGKGISGRPEYLKALLESARAAERKQATIFDEPLGSKTAARYRCIGTKLEAKMESGIFALLCVVIGALLTGVLTLFRDWRLRRSEAQSLRGALAAEIGGICQPYTCNNWMAFHALRAHRGEPLEHQSAVKLVTVVYRGNTSKLGLLPTNLASEVSGWYVSLFMWFDRVQGYPGVDGQAQIALTDERNKEADNIRDIGIKLAEKLRNRVPSGKRG